MKSLPNNWLKFITLVCLELLAGSVFAQQNWEKTLKLNNQAPELKYAKWIKGTPVDINTGDKVYVLEFWATWCRPCRKAMPHLSALAKKYEGKAVFIGCNVWEDSHGRDSKIPYDITLAKVIRFANDTVNHMGYNVIADTQDQYMGENWLKAAGESGIPSTFVIKNKILMWVGHPFDLDDVIDSIIDGKYDVVAARKAADEKVIYLNDQSFLMNGVGRKIDSAAAAKNYKRTLELIDSSNGHPAAGIFDLTKFNILLDYYSQTAALHYAEGLKKDPAIKKKILNNIAESILSKKHLSVELYNFAEECLRLQPEAGWVLHNLALAQSRAGNYKGAVASETKAIELVRQEINNPKFYEVGDTTVTHYKISLAQYQKMVK